ncbi:hypothetical protein BU23DRAFT_595687 [Bimuria novae-zelandiae CBS 107.79]|uniref:C2H2-type domain-containing protein n=1 Tax=Bimuria novae-zelandiae CBS 107.79 TaxID=1447943 RepID=A0A6A5VS35_9PLEO|nr:hypothetical protein BU23DRAFT_595687 [Bimuria novae-zelandiae CBS 107.79]
MPPRKNAPLPNAVNLFNCGICDKGYPRQIDYENHLRSYDHNHRQRLADMKKIQDANAGDAPRKGPIDLRAIPQGDASKGLGPRFKKLGGAGAATTTGGSRFKKVGVAVREAKEEEKNAEVKEASPKIDTTVTEKEDKGAVANSIVETQVEENKDEDVIMADGDDEDEVISWEEYDFTKPSDCDHSTCPGCTIPQHTTYEDGWLRPYSLTTPTPPHPENHTQKLAPTTGPSPPTLVSTRTPPSSHPKHTFSLSCASVLSNFALAPSPCTHPSAQNPVPPSSPPATYLEPRIPPVSRLTSVGFTGVPSGLPSRGFSASKCSCRAYRARTRVLPTSSRASHDLRRGKNDPKRDKSLHVRVRSPFCSVLTSAPNWKHATRVTGPEPCWSIVSTREAIMVMGESRYSYMVL